MTVFSINFLSEKFENAIQSINLDYNPKSLYEPIEYILSLGGKRVRPLLTLIASNLYNDDLEIPLKGALAIEIFHNFTLLHDDLMDKSDMRRNKETVHKKWNPNTAILSGDAMLIEAYKYITEVAIAKNTKILDLFTQTAMEVCQGQQYDMDFENRSIVSTDEYLEMIRLKTAVLLACSLKTGALISNSSIEDANNLYEFGINLGLAFQLKDDLLDVYGDSTVFGKKTGGDIANNKKTFLLIKALESSNEEQRKELIKWISPKEFDRKEKINAVKNIYDELNLQSVSEFLIKKYYLAAFNYLSAVEVPEERKRELIKLTESLMDREH